MAKEQEAQIPAEEMIDFTPSAETAALLHVLDTHLQRGFILYMAKRSREIVHFSTVLEKFLLPGETIAKLHTLKIGEDFILVTKYPRTVESDKEYTVNKFFVVKEKNQLVKYVQTTSGKKLPSEIYVIRTEKQRAKKLPTWDNRKSS